MIKLQDMADLIRSQVKRLSPAQVHCVYDDSAKQLSEIIEYVISRECKRTRNAFSSTITIEAGNLRDDICQYFDEHPDYLGQKYTDKYRESIGPALASTTYLRIEFC